MKKQLLTILFFGILMLASSRSSYACSCFASADPVKKQVETAFSSSEAVFSGEVLEVTPSADDQNDLRVTLKVKKSWKGTSTEKIIIHTARDGAMCGYSFEVGKTYLVYASGSSAKLETTNCSRTTWFSKKGDSVYLNKLARKKH